VAIMASEKRGEGSPVAAIFFGVRDVDWEGREGHGEQWLFYAVRAGPIL